MTCCRTANNTYSVQTYGFGVETAGNTASTVNDTVAQSADMSLMIDHMRVSPLLGFEEAWWDLIQARFPGETPPDVVELGQIIETESLFQLGIALGVAQIIETESLFPVGVAVTVGQIIETESLFQLGVGLGVAQLTETESLFQLGIGLGVPQIIETESLFVAGVGYVLGQITETELLFSVRATPDLVILGQIVETESLFSIGIAIGAFLVIETEVAQPVGIGIGLAQIVEFEQLFAVTPFDITMAPSVLDDLTSTRWPKILDHTRV